MTSSPTPQTDNSDHSVRCERAEKGDDAGDKDCIKGGRHYRPIKTEFAGGLAERSWHYRPHQSSERRSGPIGHTCQQTTLGSNRHETPCKHQHDKGEFRWCHLSVIL